MAVNIQDVLLAIKGSCVSHVEVDFFGNTCL